MSVNIWVTAPYDGQKILLAWGEHLHAAVDADGDNIITNFSESTVITVRETPAEIAALIAAEQRKRDRLMLAGQILATTAAICDYAYRNATVGDVIPDYIGNSVACADALLAALDAKEGAE